MPRKPATEPRRQPQQQRSKLTRDAILEAAARVFAEVGLEKATTARIAEVAGVGPGSLYQYFPSKDSLVTGLFDRESDEQQREFLELVGRVGTDDVPRLIRALIESLLATFERKTALYRVLLQEVPRVSGLAPAQRVDRQSAQSVRLLMELAGSRVKARDLDTAALLVVRAFRYAIIPLAEDPLEGAAREAFIDELTDMIAAYLLLPRPWREGT